MFSLSFLHSGGIASTPTLKRVIRKRAVRKVVFMVDS